MRPDAPARTALLILLVGSGCAALIYEVVWFQLLQLVIGSSALSIGVLLATFMGGMCAGSLLLPRIVPVRFHPLRVYCWLELGIGLLGVVIYFGLPLLGRAYVANAASGWAGFAVRGLLCGACLVPPTLLMGATLPAVSRWLETTQRGVSWLGLLYSGNTAGAVIGAALSGFYLLRVYDTAVATGVAVVLNVLVALGALVLSASMRAGASEPAQRVARAPRAVSVVHLVVALSGLSALGAEVVWTRVLSLAFGPTVYTFSMILAVFLAGLGIGSGGGALLARYVRRPLLYLGICQWLLAGAIVWSAIAAETWLPYWAASPSLSAWGRMLRFDLLRCALAVLPPTLLWGASFPLALAAASDPGDDPARLVSGLYAANTLGAIIGAIGFSIVLIPAIGTQQCQRAMIGLAVLAAALTLMRRRLSTSAALALVACVGSGALLVQVVPPVPWPLIAWGRWVNAGALPGTSPLFVGEGMNSSVAVTDHTDGVRRFHVAGKVEASTSPLDMRLQRMMGQLPLMLHPGPRSVLIVGCGAGVTAGSFVLDPGIQRIVICELEPLVPRSVVGFFAAQNYDVVHDPRVEIVYDDARHYVLTTRERFDIITSDPINPWVKGAATLYTREYFQMCKAHLKPGGIVTHWVPLYQCPEAAIKSECATFFQVFPQGTVWLNPVYGGSDAVLLGQRADHFQINADSVQSRLGRPDHRAVVQSMAEVGFSSANALLATYAGQAGELGEWLDGAEINRDLNLRLEYVAALGLDTNEWDQTCRGLMARWRYPDNLIAASPPARGELEAAIEEHSVRYGLPRGRFGRAATH